MVTTRTPPEPIRLLLVDDHPAVRDGLRGQLNAVPRFQVVGEAGDRSGALEQLGSTSPHLAIVDILLGRANDGLVLAREVQRCWPETRVLIWSMHNEAEYVAEAEAAGVRGYVLKSCPTREVVRAIEVVAEGGCYYSHGVQRSPVPRPKLTPREQQVLELVAGARTSRQIARQLGIDRRTVETHRSNVMSKLEARNVVEMVTIAIRLRLLGHKK